MDGDQLPELKPCPFCGAGETTVYANQGPRLSTLYGEPVSIEIRHWCVWPEGQPMQRMLSFVGRDREAAISVWNKRNDPAMDLLRALTTNPHFNLGDRAYDVREREGLGWDGPSVTSYGKTVTAIAKLLGLKNV